MPISRPWLIEEEWRLSYLLDAALNELLRVKESQSVTGVTAAV